MDDGGVVVVGWTGGREGPHEGAWILRLGADGVSVHVNMGDAAEGTMLADLGRVASEAHNWGLPLLAMVYGRGPLIKNSFDPEVVAHCARMAVELGADIVKVPYCGNIDSFAHVVESCCIPVVIAGGEKMDSTREFLQVVHDSIQAGAAGGFGLVIGVDRGAGADSLRASGADIVVDDLAELLA